MNGPPELDDLPEKLDRTRVGGPTTSTVTLPLRTTTPILGGAPKTRSVDDVDYIRVPSIRGQLRFWWRALYGHDYQTTEELYEAECAFWGGASRDGQIRSPIEVTVQVNRETVDEEKGKLDKNGDEFYALWPAKSQHDGTPAAPRRRPGLEFDLSIRAPETQVQDLKKTLQAWLLFGGYGGRTRRGLGSLSLGANLDEWLPTDASPEAMRELFGEGTFQRENAAGAHFPALRGAHIRSGSTSGDGRQAWLTALGWLKDFRQGTAPDPRPNSKKHARINGPNYSGLSNWPEPDKLRHLFGQHDSRHKPDRHKPEPVWPRAGFGLPIIGQFKDHADPPDYEIAWFNRAGDYMTRLASPLIVKAMPLADGNFAPIALWLDRAYPDGQVGIEQNKTPKRGSTAAFDDLVANGDTAEFKALTVGQDNQPGDRLREAFFWWLDEHGKASEVTR